MEDGAEIRWFQWLLGFRFKFKSFPVEAKPFQWNLRFLCAEHIRHVAPVMSEWPSKMCHHWTRLMPLTLCQAITRTNPDLRQHSTVEKVRIRSDAADVQSSQVFSDRGPFYWQFFALNSNLMRISCCCNSIYGHWIATNSCTRHDSYAGNLVAITVSDFEWHQTEISNEFMENLCCHGSVCLSDNCQWSWCH